MLFEELSSFHVESIRLTQDHKQEVVRSCQSRMNVCVLSSPVGCSLENRVKLYSWNIWCKKQRIKYPFLLLDGQQFWNNKNFEHLLYSINLSAIHIKTKPVIFQGCQPVPKLSDSRCTECLQKGGVALFVFQNISWTFFYYFFHKTLLMSDHLVNGT